MSHGRGDKRDTVYTGQNAGKNMGGHAVVLHGWGEDEQVGWGEAG